MGLNDDLSIVHIGYCLGRPWWHRGIMSEALKAVIDFFFNEVGANRIESRHETQNPDEFVTEICYPVKRRG